MICLDSDPRAPSAKSVYFPRSSMPRVKESLRLAVAANARVAGGDSKHFARLSEQDFGCGEARIDFNSKRFGFGGEIATDIASEPTKFPWLFSSGGIRKFGSLSRVSRSIK